MSIASVKQVRDRTWHYLDPEAAAAAGLTLQQLQQFCAGGFTPSAEQLEALARHMQVAEQ